MGRDGVVYASDLWMCRPMVYASTDHENQELLLGWAKERGHRKACTALTTLNSCRRQTHRRNRIRRAPHSLTLAIVHQTKRYMSCFQRNYHTFLHELDVAGVNKRYNGVVDKWGFGVKCTRLPYESIEYGTCQFCAVPGRWGDTRGINVFQCGRSYKDFASKASSAAQCCTGRTYTLGGCVRFWCGGKICTPVQKYCQM